jgi:hypothetical protein
VLFLLADPAPKDVDLLMASSRTHSPSGVPVILEAGSDLTLDLQVGSLAGK